MSDAWETLDRAANIIEVAGAVYFLGWAAFRLSRGRTIRVEANDGVTISGQSGGAGDSYANIVTLRGVGSEELVGTLTASVGGVNAALKGAKSDELVGTFNPLAALEGLLMWYLRVR